MGLVVGICSGLQYVETVIFKQDEGEKPQPINAPMRYNSPARVEDTRDQVSRLILGLNQTLAANSIQASDIEAVGIAHPSQVDSKSGKIIYNAALNLHNFDIVNEFRHGLKAARLPDIPAFVVRDVSAMAIAEREIGIGVDRNLDHLIYVFVDAGIGAAFILNKELYEGHNSLAGEFGNTVVKEGGQEWSSKVRGCIEAYSSKTAIARRIYSTAHLLEILPYITDMEEDSIETKIDIHIMQSVLEDEDLKPILQEASTILGIGIANLINLFNPQAVILGGHLIEKFDKYREQVVRIAKNTALRDNIANVVIEKASLSPNAEVYGGAIFALKQVNERKKKEKPE